jgi:predicted RND superfamily exporter protein
MTNQFNLSDIQNSNDKILNSISELTNLKSNIVNNISILNAAGLTGSTSSVISDLTSQLSVIESAQAKMYEQINQVNAFYDNGLLATSQIEDNQQNATQLIASETEINNERLESVSNEQNNKMRLVEINSYYGKKYNEQNQIMKTVIIVCVVVLILWFVDSKQYLKITSFIFTILISLSITIGIFVIFYKSYYLIIRNNIDFDQIDFDIPISKLPKIDTTLASSLTSSSASGSGSSNICTGSECCPPGFGYNTELNYCTLSL